MTDSNHDTDRDDITTVSIAYALPSRFERYGEPYDILIDKDDNAIIAPQSCYDGKGTLAFSKWDTVIRLGKDPEHTLAEYLSADSFPETYDECVGQELHGGRNGFCQFFQVQEMLGRHDYNFQETNPLLIEGEPVNYEAVHEAGKRHYGYSLEDALTGLDACTVTNNPVELQEEFQHLIGHIASELDNDFHTYPQNHMPETTGEYLGFFQDTKIQALKDASQTLSNSNFDRPTYFQERIASNLSHEMQPYNTVQLRRAIQSTIFPSYHGKLHGKEQRALANSIFQGLKDAPTEEKTKILADLACGGEKRQERIQSLQQTKALSR